MADAKIDWDNIQRRLAEAHESLEKGSSPNPGERSRVLKQRAEKLAKELEKTLKGEFMEVVEFLLAREHYGIETRYIREIFPLRDFTPVPCTPSFVLGLINVRGQIISVIDIKKFFDMPDKGLSELNKVVILSNGNMEFGVLADEILGVRSIDLETLQPPIPTLTGIREEFLRGVTGERTVILDADKMLTDKNIIVHEEIR